MKNERREEVEAELEYAASLSYEPKMSGASVVILAAEVRRLRAIEEVARKMANALEEAAHGFGLRDEYQDECRDAVNEVLSLPAVVELLKEQNNG